MISNSYKKLKGVYTCIKEYEIEEYTAIEEQIHYYCKCLLVSHPDHPDQIIKYLEKG